MNTMHSFAGGLQFARPSWALRVVRALVFPGALLVMAQPSAGDSGTFEQTGSLGTGRYFHTGTLLPNGKVLVAGGRTGFPSGTVIASAVETVRPAADAKNLTVKVILAAESEDIAHAMK